MLNIYLGLEILKTLRSLWIFVYLITIWLIVMGFCWNFLLDVLKCRSVKPGLILSTRFSYIFLKFINISQAIDRRQKIE